MKLKQQHIIGFLFLPLLIITLYSDLDAQIIKSIEAYGNYSVALNRFGAIKKYVQSDLKVTDANGVGGGVKINFNVYKNYSIGISYGYQLYTIHQDSALEKWNWLFWNTRYKGFVKDALASDPTLSGILSPAQKLDLYPLFITIDAEYKPIEKLTVSPSLGVGMAMFTRRLYLEETWQKRFDALGYTFGYSFENFAPNKTGNPFALSAGAKIAYEFKDGYKIHAELGYIQFIRTPGKEGSSDFPLERIINAKLGLTFAY